MRTVATSSSTATTTTTLLPQQQEWSSHSRSRTEPVIKRAEVPSHQSRRSVDATPRPAGKPSPERAAQSETPADSFKGIPSAGDQQSPTRKTNPRRYSVDPTSSSIPLSPGTLGTREGNNTLTSPKSGLVTPSATSYFKFQPNSPGGEPRSPPQKRAPASRSSHGIETSTGPPPAISTQRTYSQDKLWRPSQPLEVLSPQPLPSKPIPDLTPSLRPSGSVDSAGKDNTSTPQTESNESSAVPSRNNSVKEEGKEMTRMNTHYGEDLERGDADRTLRGMEGIMGDRESAGTGSDNQSQPRNEDVFLNIARANSQKKTAAERAEERKSRLHSNYRFARDYSATSSQVNASSEADAGSPPLEEPGYNLERSLPSLVFDSLNRRSSLQTRSYAASAHPLDDAGRRYFDQPTRSSFGYSRSRLGRDNSPESPQLYDRRVSAQDSTRTYRNSNLSAVRSNRLVSGQDIGHPAEGEVRQLEGTESTMSTNAPSTVWDELDDLKSRIRRLELTGKLPNSSAAAVTNATVERPRTATTTVTTMSSSPKHCKKTSSSPTESPIQGSTSSTNQLLHSALGKAKPVVSKEVYQALEAAASDALSLATLIGNGNTSSAVSTVGNSTPLERQIRRKADSMCRSITELCITLSDEQTATPSKQRPASRDASMSQLSSATFGLDGASRYQRTATNEPEERPRTSSRVVSRLEARRTSMLLGGQTSSTNGTPTETRYETPPINTPPSNTGRPTPARTSTTLFRARRSPNDPNPPDTNHPDENPTMRPVSRAMTELASNSTLRSSPRDSRAHRTSREYTSQYPLPDTVQRSPSLIQTSAVPPRRNYLSAIPNPNPSTPPIQPGNRRYASRYVSNSVNTLREPTEVTRLPSKFTFTATPTTNQTGLNKGVSVSTRSEVGGSTTTSRGRGWSTGSTNTRKTKVLSLEQPSLDLLPQRSYNQDGRPQTSPQSDAVEN